MRKLLVLILLIPSLALGQTVEKDLIGLGLSPEVSEYLATILPAGSVLGNNTYLKARNVGNSADVNILKLDNSDNTVLNSSASDELIFQLEDDASRLISLTAASDAALAIKFGDAGTTATQILVASSSTADADDDSTLRACGGGAYAADGSRGACISLPGEEVAGGGDIAYVAGASDTHVFSAGSTQTMSIGATGVVTAAAGFVATTGGVSATGGITAVTGDIVATAGDLQLTASGKTIEYETGTAASACAGTSTLNGTSAVTITTTCATAGSLIFISRTSDGSGSAANDQVGAWATNIQAGVSFDIDSGDANDSATINWLILHEAP